MRQINFDDILDNKEGLIKSKIKASDDSIQLLCDFINLNLNIRVILKQNFDDSKNELMLSLSPGKRDREFNVYLEIKDDFLKKLGFNHSIFSLKISGFSNNETRNNIIKLYNRTETPTTFELFNCSTENVLLSGNFENVDLIGNRLNNVIISNGIQHRICLTNNKTSRELPQNSNRGNIWFRDNETDILSVTGCHGFNDLSVPSTTLVKKSSFSSNEIKTFTFIDKKFQFLNISNNTFDSLIVSNLEVLDGKFGKVDISNNTILKTIYLEKLDFRKGKIKYLSFTPLICLEYKNNDIKNQFITQNVIWNYRNLFSEDESEILPSILQIKSEYSKIKDTHNERIFESFEKRWYFQNEKFDFPLWISWWSNSFGLSICRPFLWILICFFVQVIFFLLISGTCSQIFLSNWGLFTHIFNPTHRTEIFINILNNYQCESVNSFENWIYLIDNTFRILMGYLIFQFISAFRYKYNLK